ncbi:hypothetical protein WJX84_009568 [Apatococcus fuscideae]|uniref:Protein kinase domain-containing protein n=1 Tax=Apatococcus fuscideae TaxID=2026836 RepID=A0AAW1T4W0_9CHLO
MAQALSLTPTPTPHSIPYDTSAPFSISSHSTDPTSDDPFSEASSRRQDSGRVLKGEASDEGTRDQTQILAPFAVAKRPSEDTAFQQLGKEPAKVAATSSSSQRPSSSVVSSLSTGLMGTYDRCRPKERYLTKPSEGTHNEGFDNDNHDLVVYMDMVLDTPNTRYTVKGILGQGTFGQVVECVPDTATKAPVAVKVIKNQAAFYHQARVEVGVLQYLNTRSDPDNTHHIVRMKDFFNFRNHLCLVFELLSVNLYELIKHNNFRGLSMNLLRVFISQILDALVVLRDSNIIHCDLKPENVLLRGLDNGDIKVIDFGSACFENRTMYSYIQSRFYRSPEVVLGYPYDVAVDMWSLGCMAAELFLGLPLFPGASEHDLLVRIVEMLGAPPDWLLHKAQNTAKFFRSLGPGPAEDQGAFDGDLGSPQFVVRTQAEFEAMHGQQAPAGKRYFHHTKLQDIIGAYPYKGGLSDSDTRREKRLRDAFLDFLLGVLDLNPVTRWSPRQAQQHPFVTGSPFTGPFQPPPDARPPPRVPSAVPSLPLEAPYNGISGFWSQPSSTGQLMPNSPEAHAQAHAVALAAVQAQFQQQMQQQPAAGSLPLQLQGAGASMGYGSSLPATSYGGRGHAQTHSQPLPSHHSLGAAYPAGLQGLSSDAFQMPSSRHQALPQQIPGSMRGLENYHTAQAMLQSGGSLPRGASLGQSLGGSLSYQPPDHAAAAASLAANAALMQQQQLMSGGSGSYHTAHSSGGLLPVGSLEALRHTWQAPFGSRAQQQALRQQLSQQASGSGQSSWETPGWGGGNLGATPTRGSGGMTLGSGLPAYPGSSHGYVSGQSQTGTRTTRRRSGGLPAAPSSRSGSLQGGSLQAGSLRQQLQAPYVGQIDDQGGAQDLAGTSLGLLGHTPLSLYNAVPEHMQWPQPHLPETPVQQQQQLPHRSGTAASMPQTHMVLSPESHSSVPNPADWDPLYSDDLLLNEDGQQRRTSEQRLPSSLHSMRDLGSLDAASSSMMSTGSATFLQPSSQGPYDAVWHRPQPTSHPFSFQGDGPAMSQVQAQAQANLGLLPSNSGTLPEALHDPTLAFQASQQAQGYDPAGSMQQHQQGASLRGVPASQSYSHAQHQGSEPMFTPSQSTFITQQLQYHQQLQQQQQQQQQSQQQYGVKPEQYEAHSDPPQQQYGAQAGPSQQQQQHGMEPDPEQASGPGNGTVEGHRRGQGPVSLPASPFNSFNLG